MEARHERSGRRWWILAGATLLYLATVADGPIFTLAVPSIGETFAASITEVQLLINAAALMVAALVLTGGSLGDLYGRKRIFLIGGVGLVVSLLLQAASPSMWFLIGVRALDGVFSAITTPLAVALLTLEFDEDELPMALGIFTGAVGLGEAFLPLGAGWLNDAFGWRATFVITITAAVLATLLVARFAHESRDPNPRRLDLPGLLLCAVSMAGLVIALIAAGGRGWTDAWVLVPATIGLSAGVAFIVWERRAPDPALPLALFKSRPFVVTFVLGIGVFFVLMPVQPLINGFFQTVQGYDVLTTAWLLIPYSLGVTLASPFAKRLTQWCGIRGGIAIGCAAMGAGVGILMLLTPSTPYAVIGTGLGLLAAGYGLVNPSRVSVLMSSAPTEVSGAASGANSLGVEFGTSVGLALGTTLTVSFAGNAYYGLLRGAGLSEAQSGQVIANLEGILRESSTTATARIPQQVLDALAAGALDAYTTGIAWTMAVFAGVMVVSAIIAWYGLRSVTIEREES